MGKLIRWIALVAMVLVASACDETAQQRSGQASIDALGEQVASGDWALRKLAQRQLWLQRHGDNSETARRLVDAARHAKGNKAILRLVRQAFVLSETATISRVAELTADTSLSLDTRVLAIQVLARDVSTDRAPAAFAATARALMASEARGSERWGIGLRLLSRFARAEAWPLVQAALDAGGAERRWASAALSEQTFDGAMPSIEALLGHDSRYVQKKALKALRLYADDATLRDAAVIFVSPLHEAWARAHYAWAREHHKLWCTIDRPELCTFINPAATNVSGIGLRIVSGGVSPGLIRRLRIDLERVLGEPRVAAFVQSLAHLRSKTPRSKRAEVMRAAIDGLSLKARLVLPEWFEQGREPPSSD